MDLDCGHRADKATRSYYFNDITRDNVDVSNICPLKYPHWINHNWENYDFGDFDNGDGFVSRNLTDCSPFLWEFDDLIKPGTEDEVEPYTEDGSITC